MSIILGSSILLIIFGIIIFGNITSSSSESWDKGFNYEWVGDYASKADEEYFVTFTLKTDGKYTFIYGLDPSAATIYTGKYDKNFKYGTTLGRLNYKISNLKIIGYNRIDRSIKLEIDWENPKSTDRYNLYLSN